METAIYIDNEAAEERTQKANYNASDQTVNYVFAQGPVENDMQSPNVDAKCFPKLFPKGRGLTKRQIGTTPLKHFKRHIKTTIGRWQREVGRHCRFMAYALSQKDKLAISSACTYRTWKRKNTTRSSSSTNI